MWMKELVNLLAPSQLWRSDLSPCLQCSSYSISSWIPAFSSRSPSSMWPQHHSLLFTQQPQLPSRLHLTLSHLPVFTFDLCTYSCSFYFSPHFYCPYYNYDSTTLQVQYLGEKSGFFYYVLTFGNQTAGMKIRLPISTAKEWPVFPSAAGSWPVQTMQDNFTMEDANNVMMLRNVEYYGNVQTCTGIFHYKQQPCLIYCVTFQSIIFLVPF